MQNGVLFSHQNKMMTFAQNWNECVIIILSDVGRLCKKNISFFLSYADSWPKKDINIKGSYLKGDSRKGREEWEYDGMNTTKNIVRIH
jgi:hypothetical protein